MFEPAPPLFGGIAIVLMCLMCPPAYAQTKVPFFAFVSLDDSSRLISNESMIGTFYLVDFWATWCPPCVEGIPGLTATFEKFKARKFQIISLSFDKSPQAVERFRKKRYAMPWIHGFLERGFGDFITTSFNVQNIPHFVLVDDLGFVRKEFDEIAGSELEGMLESLLPRAESMQR